MDVAADLTWEVVIDRPNQSDSGCKICCNGSCMIAYFPTFVYPYICHLKLVVLVDWIVAIYFFKDGSYHSDCRIWNVDLDEHKNDFV